MSVVFAFLLSSKNIGFVLCFEKMMIGATDDVLLGGWEWRTESSDLHNMISLTEDHLIRVVSTGGEILVCFA